MATTNATATERIVGNLPAGFLRFPNDNVEVLDAIKDKHGLWSFVVSQCGQAITLAKYRHGALVAVVAATPAPFGKHAARLRLEGEVVICEQSIDGGAWVKLCSATVS